MPAIGSVSLVHCCDRNPVSSHLPFAEALAQFSLQIQTALIVGQVVPVKALVRWSLGITENFLEDWLLL